MKNEAGNKQPIEHARDADLRLSHTALQRAAHRARDLAQETGTAIVISRDGVIEYLTPGATINVNAVSVHQPLTPYDNKNGNKP